LIFSALGFSKWFVPSIFIIGVASVVFAILVYQAKKIETLLVDNSILSEQVDRNEVLVGNLYTKIAQQSMLNGELDKRMKESEAKREELSNKFREHKLNQLAEAKPQWIERIINNGTSEVFRDIESITTP